MTHRTEGDLTFRRTIRQRLQAAPYLCPSHRRRCLVHSLYDGRM